MNVNPLLRVTLLVAVAASVFGAEPANARGDLQRIDIVDANGFAQPMNAVSVQVPAGWRPEGGVRWDRRVNCVNNQVHLDWVARSPDGRQAFEIMRGFSWQVSGTQLQMNPCPAQPLNTARAYLEAVVQQRRSGARVLQYRDRPDMASALAKGGPGNAQMRLRYDAGDLLIAYRVDGTELREVLSTAVTFSEFRGNVMGRAANVTALRAPNGELDFALADRIAGSIRLDPGWQSSVVSSLTESERRFSSGQRNDIDRWHAGEMARINAKGAADRAAIRSQTNRDVARIYSETNASTQASNDRNVRRGLEATGEYNTYQDASGNRVRSSIHGGNRVLRMPDGSVTSTNDPYFKPPGSEELQRVR